MRYSWIRNLDLKEGLALRLYIPVAVGILLVSTAARGQLGPTTPVIVQGTLTAPGNPSFYLKANLAEPDDQEPSGHMEMFWVNASKWRRSVQFHDFSQTIVVNGKEVFEQDSDDYFPVGISFLISAITNPKVILNAHRPEDGSETKANGRASESGIACYGPNSTLCVKNRYGLSEMVGMPGNTVDFSRYEKFKGMRIARVVTDTEGVRDFVRAEIIELKELKDADESLFAVPNPTPNEKQIRTVVLADTEFRALAIESPQIIWPQVLDGQTTGTASFYIAIDRRGTVREVRWVHTDNERSNDSARNQIMRWKFKPATVDGLPAQAQSILTFPLNTRQFGPADILSDADARKLVSNMVDPVFPAGTASGTSFSLWVAIDADGHLIEAIHADGPPALWDSCYGAVRQWQFSPIMENGQPRPYRAKLRFVVP
jgi:hypothetical protein